MLRTPIYFLVSLLLGTTACLDDVPTGDDVDDDDDGLLLGAWAPPGTGWTKVFEDGFNYPHEISADGKTYNIVRPDGTRVPAWTSIGVQPLSSCGRVNTETGRLTLWPFAKFTDSTNTKQNCRLATVTFFGSGTYIFSARAKAHSGTGRRTSFWVAGGPSNDVNEIDVFENEGQKKLATGCKGGATVTTNTSLFTGINFAHYSSYVPITGTKYCHNPAIAVTDDAFHVFSAEWTPGVSVKFSIDGVLIATFGAQYAKANPVAALLTNHAMGATLNGDTTRPFVVDWVKIYKKN
jgi:hypothetical protein